MPLRSPGKQARALFAPLGPTYDRVRAALALLAVTRVTLGSYG